MWGVWGAAGMRKPHTKPEAAWAAGVSKAESEAWPCRCLPANGALGSAVTSTLGIKALAAEVRGFLRSVFKSIREDI